MTFQKTFADDPSLTSDERDEILATGHTLYRRAEDNLVESLAILRAAVLVMTDLSVGTANPFASLELCLSDLRLDATGMILSMQDN